MCLLQHGRCGDCAQYYQAIEGGNGELDGAHYDQMVEGVTYNVVL